MQSGELTLKAPFAGRRVPQRSMPQDFRLQRLDHPAHFGVQFIDAAGCLLKVATAGGVLDRHRGRHRKRSFKVRRQPFQAMRAARGQFDISRVERGSQFGNQVEDWLRAEAETLRTAPVKITDTKEMVNVSIAAPGFKPEEIEVSVKGNMLIVSGETEEEERKENEETFYSEWSSDKFLRKLTLPAEVETANVDAQLKDGILTLALKKKAVEEAAKVSVKAA